MSVRTEAIAYKFRAECQLDIAHVLVQPHSEAADPIVITEWKRLKPAGVEIACLTRLSIDDLKSMMYRVVDGHVMAETLALADDYTGERCWPLNDEETQLIAQAATQVAGAIFEDTAGEHIEDRLQAARKWQNQGTDADLTSEDRIALDLLHDAATGITSDLTDAETNEVIRTATIEEACQSATAINGIILVDGRRVYVAQ